MRTRSTLTALLVPALVLGGCGAGPEAELASDACDLLQQVVDEGPEALMTGERMEDFQELEQRAADEDISDEEMEQAMRDECPETFEELETMLPEDMGPAPDEPQDGGSGGEPEGDVGQGEGTGEQGEGGNDE